MQAGVPLVATDLPSVREILRHGEHGLLVPPDDPAALAQAIETLLRDRVLAARLVRTAATHVLGFSWEARARRILEFAATPAPDCGPGGGGVSAVHVYLARHGETTWNLEHRLQGRSDIGLTSARAGACAVAGGTARATRRSAPCSPARCGAASTRPGHWRKRARCGPRSGPSWWK